MSFQSVSSTRIWVRIFRSNSGQQHPALLKERKRLDRAGAINMTLLTECKPDGAYAT
jgi:hypothetical protein